MRHIRDGMQPCPSTNSPSRPVCPGISENWNEVPQATSDAFKHEVCGGRLNNSIVTDIRRRN